MGRIQYRYESAENRLGEIERLLDWSVTVLGDPTTFRKRRDHERTATIGTTVLL